MMMAAPKVSKKKVSQTINLRDEFGIDFSGKPELREAVGQAILDKIKSRTASGKGVKFSSSGAGTEVSLKKPYSKEYVKSLDFRAAGKSKNKVNMRLTGDMLELMDITKNSGNNITIGWNGGDEQDAKAFNHVTGDTVPARPFFGVSKKELKSIKSEIKGEIKEALSIREKEGRSSFDDFVLQLAEKFRKWRKLKLRA